MKYEKKEVRKFESRYQSFGIPLLELDYIDLNGFLHILSFFFL